MNKAFTKESDNDEFTEAVVQPVDLLPPNVPNYVTPEGHVVYVRSFVG